MAAAATVRMGTLEVTVRMWLNAQPVQRENPARMVAAQQALLPMAAAATVQMGILGITARLHLQGTRTMTKKTKKTRRRTKTKTRTQTTRTRTHTKAKDTTKEDTTELLLIAGAALIGPGSARRTTNMSTTRTSTTTKDMGSTVGTALAENLMARTAALF